MRLIDADVLFDELVKKRYSAQSMGILRTEYPNMMAIVSKQPTVDAVEVVRCKDCKDVKMLVDIIGEPHLFCCNGRSINRMKVEFDDYCSYGERKEE